MSLGRKPARLLAVFRDGLKDAIAGLIASVVLIANIVSFGALMFPGAFAAGIPTAIWAMLIGSAVGGAWIALRTSLPPIATGIDSPTGAVLVVLSAQTGAAVLAAGGTAQAAVQTIMLVFTAATIVSGVSLYMLGALRWGSYFRFVPYFVVGGFLSATGWFLITGGVRMATGATLHLASFAASWPRGAAAKLASSIGALAVLLVVRARSKSAFAVPLALIGMWAACSLGLSMLGNSGAEQGWYLSSVGALTPWTPLTTLPTTHFTASTILALLPELLAVTVVALISLVTKVSSIEVARRTSGDLDREFSAHGVASLIAAPCGGLISSVQTGTSRLLEHAGGATRMSGVACSLLVGAVGLTQLNLPGLIPIPIVAGLVFFLGYTFLVDALWRPYVQRAWLDVALAVAIMIVCIVYGYLAGVLIGIVSACVLFALSYARLGVVRRHVSRAQFGSYVDRSAEASRHLQNAGEAIQVYWLSGYIFFGSSEGVFERIRRDVESRGPGEVRYAILDFAMVSGVDSSAVASLVKLRNLCDKKRIALVYCSLSRKIGVAFRANGLLGANSPHQAFADLNVAIAWCEDRLLADATLETAADIAGFESWLQRQLGGGAVVSDLVGYLERKDADGARVFYRQGEAADTVDLVAIGNLAVDIATNDGGTVRVRRISTHSVVGEMGFFRRASRSATVSSDGAATIFTLTRESFERMQRERPDLATAFYDFIVRVLAERIDSANRAVTALSRG